MHRCNVSDSLETTVTNVTILTRIFFYLFEVFRQTMYEIQSWKTNRELIFGRSPFAALVASVPFHLYFKS